jgi:hypothetical protein
MDLCWCITTFLSFYGYIFLLIFSEILIKIVGIVETPYLSD